MAKQTNTEVTELKVNCPNLNCAKEFTLPQDKIDFEMGSDGKLEEVWATDDIDCPECGCTIFEHFDDIPLAD